jgi:hypothetical protein
LSSHYHTYFESIYAATREQGMNDEVTAAALSSSIIVWMEAENIKG